MGKSAKVQESKSQKVSKYKSKKVKSLHHHALSLIFEDFVSFTLSLFMPSCNFTHSLLISLFTFSVD